MKEKIHIKVVRKLGSSIIECPYRSRVPYISDAIGRATKCFPGSDIYGTRLGGEERRVEPLTSGGRVVGIDGGYLTKSGIDWLKKERGGRENVKEGQMVTPVYV